eukprot:TRINITY_DN126_c0_g1_i1.p1 TRINITY_DN126_c0_g1~~TRINITY_DN126_c0_g1_i1.p1  ORF type:complete len:340 (+),score=38.57 TRINITY_DN126_c0_g1_i1:220-1239(+)
MSMLAHASEQGTAKELHMLDLIQSDSAYSEASSAAPCRSRGRPSSPLRRTRRLSSEAPDGASVQAALRDTVRALQQEPTSPDDTSEAQNTRRRRPANDVSREAEGQTGCSGSSSGSSTLGFDLRVLARVVEEGLEWLETNSLSTHGLWMKASPESSEEVIQRALASGRFPRKSVGDCHHVSSTLVEMLHSVDEGVIDTPVIERLCELRDSCSHDGVCACNMPVKCAQLLKQHLEPQKLRMVFRCILHWQLVLDQGGAEFEYLPNTFNLLFSPSWQMSSGVEQVQRARDVMKWLMCVRHELAESLVGPVHLKLGFTAEVKKRSGDIADAMVDALFDDYYC